MKTPILSLLAAFLLLSLSAFSQDQKTVFENASLIKTSNGTPCVALSWKKGTENTAYYLVERSVDGNEFKQIALVFTGENPEFTSYQYKDKSITSASGTVYYRIILVNDQKVITPLPTKKVVLSADVNSIMQVDFSKDVAKQ